MSCSVQFVVLRRWWIPYKGKVSIVIYVSTAKVVAGYIDSYNNQLLQCSTLVGQ